MSGTHSNNMNIDYLTLFIIGFLGGFSHCIGMCGGIVLTYTLKVQENDPVEHPSKWQMIKPHLLYNGGRILTYTFLESVLPIAVYQRFVLLMKARLLEIHSIDKTGQCETYLSLFLR